MFARMLVAVDGSPVSGKALEFGIARAKLHDSEITVAFAVNRLAVSVANANPYAYVDPLPLLQALDAEADASLAAAERRVRDAGLSARRAKLDGPPARALLAYARQVRSDAILMGTHGRSGLERLALGSTAEDVIRAASVPVIAIPQRCPEIRAAALSRLLVAVDGSPAADAALAVACDIARREKATLTICAIAEPGAFDWDDVDRDLFLSAPVEEQARPLLERSARRAADACVKAGVDLRSGSAVAEILAAAVDCGAECIVMGTHGRAGLPRFILGSVAEGVLRSSPLPVCIVRHQ
ncbi:MAG: universal stress protein [Candidatus Tumulicola sp.]